VSKWTAICREREPPNEVVRTRPAVRRHGILAGSYGQEHRAPFDRVLAAQAIIEGFALVTDDSGMDVLGRR
jgi:PIN domain nuclease of toxin-antitoxin system